MTIEFTGACVNGLTNGKGILKLYSKNNLIYTYDGESKDGWPNGQGALTSSMGAKYVGSFKNGKQEGQGAINFPNGDKYVGEYKDGKYNGQGTYTSASGDKYVGEFKDGNFNGQGTYTHANGNKYVGEFKGSKKDGEGTLYSLTGSVISQGIFAADEFIRSAPILLAEQKIQIARIANLEEKLNLIQQQPTVTQTAPMTTLAKRRALVIGNDSYASVTKLVNAREDAKSIASNLTSVGYQVTLKLDLNAR